MASDDTIKNDWQYNDDTVDAAEENNASSEETSGGMDPLLMNAIAPDIDDDESNVNKSLNRTTIGLFSICIIAVVAIFLISRGQKPEPISEEEKAKSAALDMALAKLTSQAKEQTPQSLDAENMVEVFYNYPTNTQVSADELQRNPFMRDEDAPDETVVVVEKNKGPDLDALQKKLKELHLQSLGGTICLINNNVLTEGDKVSDFVIKKIEDNQVILTAENIDFSLKL